MNAKKQKAKQRRRARKLADQAWEAANAQNLALAERSGTAEPTPDGFCGGEFLLCDVPDRSKSRQYRIAAGIGDAVLFCTRDRLVCVGGAWGLQPVKHGVSRITAGTRFVLGVPFHEYR